MLIIAIPKSASTSLLRTLGIIHELASTQDFKLNEKYAVPASFRHIGNLHSDCINIDQALVEKWTNKKKFYKQHIPPTSNNLSLLRNKKKVILLRPPKEIILAYRRAQLTGVHDEINEFKDCDSEDEWIKRAKNNGLFEELNNFYTNWETHDDNNCLVINYSELINSPTKLINNMSRFYNLKSDFSNISLKKARYSKHNKFQRFFYKLRKKLGRFLR